MKYKNVKLLFSFIASFIFFSCSSHGPGLFSKKTPHEQYEKKLIDSGLKETALGDAWLKAAAVTLSNPLDVSLPYSETGYFAPDRANAVGLRFSAKRGQKIKVSLTKKPVENFGMYVDLWQPASQANNSNPKFLAAADSTKLLIEYTVNDDNIFIVRIQPELLKEGEYTVTIIAGPSLAFPISPKVKSNIGSFYGVGRDKGERKHEGIDIFAPVNSPAVAAANGIITRVNENSLGGKVIFMRPDNSSYNLYYAHLDSQIATEGQHVNTGDVIGLTGNTGNAKFTASHLHFGVYTFSGAIDPLYFVKSEDEVPVKLSVSLNNLNTWMRAGKSTKLYLDQSVGSKNFIALEENTLIRPEAGTRNLYRIILPNGQKGFITASTINSVLKPLKKITLKKSQALLSSPDSNALHKKVLAVGDRISILASFKNYYFVKEGNDLEGWISKNEL